MSEKVTITIEANEKGVNICLNGMMKKEPLLQGAAMLAANLCEVTGTSPEVFFKLLALLSVARTRAHSGTAICWLNPKDSHEDPET